MLKFNLAQEVNLINVSTCCCIPSHLTDETQVIGVHQAGTGGPIAQYITETQRGNVWQDALQCKV